MSVNQIVDYTDGSGGDQTPRLTIIAHDADWQFPAVTEQYAYQQIQALPIAAGIDSAYFAFPWATLIDFLNNGEKAGAALKEILQELGHQARDFSRVFTVCQHILAPKYRELFYDNGVTDVFWAHARKGQDTLDDNGLLKVHPFPLFPVQFPSGDLHADFYSQSRPHLFSFVGARANEWYLTKARDWIIDELSGDARGFVRGRDEWHFNKIVYDHQIRQENGPASQFVNQDASEQFKAILQQSVFALCPSGTGPNSIRLWEAINSGAIPVILSDQYLPPGNLDLWQEACVFVDETREAIAHLPTQLEKIVEDTSLLESKRAALQQLRMLYGPACFVYDIQALALRVGQIDDDGAAEQMNGVYQLSALARAIARGRFKAETDYSFFLMSCTSQLLARPGDFEATLQQEPAMKEACEKALIMLKDSPLAERFLAALKLAEITLPSQSLENIRKQDTVCHICLLGRHSNFTPFAYDAYKPYFQNDIVICETIDDADIVVSGFHVEFQAHAKKLIEWRQASSQSKLAIFSEEPLWDTVWTEDYHAGEGLLKKDGASTEYAIFNHANEKLYDFEAVPYFLTTDDKYFLRYAAAFNRNAQLSVDDLLSIWQKAPLRTAIFAENRSDPRYDVAFPDDDVFGLSVYRTEMAQALTKGDILRVGKGWDPKPEDRRSLPDWHLDKLATLTRKAFVISALENTHCSNYITEKIFDAFAALGVPVYYASEHHRIFSLIDAEAFINVFGDTPQTAAARIDAFTPDRSFAVAYLENQRRLAKYFADFALLHNERARVAKQALAALNSML